MARVILSARRSEHRSRTRALRTTQLNRETLACGREIHESSVIAPDDVTSGQGTLRLSHVLAAMLLSSLREQARVSHEPKDEVRGVRTQRDDRETN
eukprot:1195917-Pyramimonas_sp.AAC.1